MNAQLIIAVIQILASTVESLTSNQQVENAITILEAWLPTIVNEFNDLLPMVQNIIATLKGNATLTADQIATVTTMSQTADAAADAALKAAGYIDPAATTGS